VQEALQRLLLETQHTLEGVQNAQEGSELRQEKLGPKLKDMLSHDREV